MTMSDSDASARSLRSQGPVTVDTTQPTRARKQAASWTQAKEAEFLTYLSEEFPSTGDGGFKKTTFVGAVNHLKEKFPVQQGAEKTWEVCRMKWQSVDTNL
jgi:hypothetical protein